MTVAIDRQEGFSMVFANGGWWVGPDGTAAPDGVDAPDTDLWYAGGAVSDDGFIQGIAENSQQWTPAGTTTPWRTEITSSVKTMQFTPWELHRPVVVALQNRIPVEDVVEDEDGIVSFAEDASPSPERHSFLFLFLNGATVHRLYFPHGEVTDRGNVTWKQTEQASSQWTVTAYPDENNKTIYHSYFTAQRQAALLG